MLVASMSFFYVDAAESRTITVRLFSISNLSEFVKASSYRRNQAFYSIYIFHQTINLICFLVKVVLSSS